MADLGITVRARGRGHANVDTPDRALDLKARRIQLGNPVLLGYRRMIDQAVASAKKTRQGHPTDLALQDRWWLQTFRPLKPRAGDADYEFALAVWRGSFAGCCEMLAVDVDAERSRLLAEVDDAWAKAALKHVADAAYRRMPQVLACAGMSAAIARQYVLGLADPDEYEDVAGIDRPDPPERKRRKPLKARGSRRLEAGAAAR